MLKLNNENNPLSRRDFIIGALASAITLQSNTILAQDVLRVDEKTAKDILYDLLLIIDPNIQASIADHYANFEYNDQWEWIYRQDFSNPAFFSRIQEILEFLRKKGSLRYFASQGNAQNILLLLRGTRKVRFNYTKEHIVQDEESESSIQQFQQGQIRKFAQTIQGTPEKPLWSKDSSGRIHYFYGKPKDVPNPLNVNHFYGTGVGKNIPGTYLNAKLYGFVRKGDIPKQISSRGNILIRTSQIDGLNYTAVYDTNGELKILTYVSIGTDEDPTNLTRITKNTSQKDLIQMNKISIQGGGSSMWGAIHVSGGIFFHSSALGINGRPRSHGCIRTPLLYLDAMHKLIRENPATSIVMEFDSLY